MLTSVCLVTHVTNQKRLNDLHQVLTSLYHTLRGSVELIIVDDKSPLEDTKEMLLEFQRVVKSFPIVIHFNETNLKHPASQNKSMELAKGDVLIHIEDDIVVDYIGWNQIFAKHLQDHPEVGQVLPYMSGRGEWIPRLGYDEFCWGLGGLWAIRRGVFKKIGGWDASLTHQIEPDYNIRVRMAGWRLAQIPEFMMVHLGEGDQEETFERQAQIHVGVYNFLKKWNRRFFGTFDYTSIWTMSPEDYPINVAFRRQLAAWNVSKLKTRQGLLDSIIAGKVKCTPEQRAGLEEAIELTKKCRMNESPEPFKYPGHWGVFEIVKLIRSPGRERENELIEKMGNDYVFKDVAQLHQQIKDLSIRMNHPMTDQEVSTYLKGKQVEYDWEAKTTWE